ncbi:hypothetical protein CHS0354_040235 [Potamilus streckersoni]|uniref:Uncharacterized protein n=1 Tax=Potamilus streckersoni TaxID=2493646 RepID=A0AAE0S4X3_9BIVA|nr:hypothetical protein CHS0354_040235 [Potamilus streckersoni]
MKMKLNCPVCAKKYKSPKVLSCGHTVCYRCLNSHITIGAPMQGYISEYLSSNEPPKKVPAKTEFTCPVKRCNMQIVPPDPQRPTWTWADQFPNNLTIASLIDKSEKNDTGPKSCDFCSQVGKLVVASGFCEDCIEAFCSKCIYIHRLVQKDHNLEIWSHCKDASDEISRNNVDHRKGDNCPFHSMEPANIFCKDHKAVCCIICSCTEHKSCSVIPVDALFAEGKDGFCIGGIRSRLAECNKNIMELVQDRQNTLKSVDDQKETILTQVLSLKGILQELMENLESKAKQKLEEINTDIKREMEADMKRFEFLKEAVAGTNARLQAEVPGQHRTKSVHMFLEIEKECGKIEEEIQTTTKTRNVCIQFTIEDQVEKMIKEVRQMEEKGDVLKSSFHLDPGRKFTKSGENKNTEKGQQSQQYVEKVLEVDAQIPSDTRPCWLTDCVFLHNGELLVVDNENMRVKLFSADCHFMGDLAMSAKPWGIAVSSNDTDQLGAVTLPEACTVSILETVPNLKLRSEFHTPGACYGIGFLSGERLVVSCENNNKAALHIFSSNGDEIRLIDNDEHLSGLLFSKPRYLSVTKNNTIYISDGRRYQISHTNLEGKQDSQFTDSKLISPAGIALDHNENIIACGNGSLNVFWFCKKINGEHIQILTDWQLPRAIALHPIENKFVITQDSGKFKSFLQFFMLKEIPNNDSLKVCSMLEHVV